MLVQTSTSFHPDKEEGVGGAQKHINQEEQEVLLIVVAYTVVDPGTVMVHSSDTTLADGTMVTFWGFYGLAFFALFA
mgnify:CR=1 FL=1